MTTSNDPKKPSTGGKSRPAKSYRTPLSRRVRYLAQDTGYALKKAGRRAADPIRDAKRPRRRKPKAAAEKPPARKEPPAKRPPAKPEKPEAKPRRPARKVSQPASKRVRGPRRRRAPERKRTAKQTAARAAKSVEGFGERSSKLIRGVLAPLLVPLVALVALGRRGFGWLAAAITPLRAALAVSVLAAILLGVSQFVDYRGVAVGAPEYAAYADVEPVAPAPEVDREPAGSAHAYLGVPLALLAIALLVLAARGRWQLGRVVALLGILAIAVAIIVDVPAGLDESAQAIAYSGVEAHLIEGFWVQLVSAAVLVAGGLLVSHYARRSKQRAPRQRARAAVAPARAKTA